MTEYQDIRLQGWGKEIDYNIFPNQAAFKKAQVNHTDIHSSFGDPQFIDPGNGNFSVSAQSPAINVGFINFTMNNFGVEKPALKQLAKKPEIPSLIIQNQSLNSTELTNWLGSELKNIQTIEERSAAGLRETGGVLINSVEHDGLSAKSGLQQGDVITGCENKEVASIPELLGCYQGNNWKGQLELTIIRNQQEQNLVLKTK